MTDENNVRAIAISGQNVYVGGEFTSAGGVVVNNIAKWSTDTNSWSALDVGTSSYVNAIATDGTNIYVGGSFISAGGGVVNNIAKWDTTANSGSGGWSPLGSGTFGSVFAIAVSDSGKDVYAGGAFHKVTGCTGTDGADCYRIAKWDTTANSGSGGWSPLGKGTAVGDVFAIAVDSSNNVFVGGDFTSAKGTTSAGDCASCKYIAKWDTTVNSGSGGWLALGSGIVGVDDSVSAIATDGTNIYVGGSFTSAGGGVVNNIAKWNGTAWSALGSGMDYAVSAIAISGTNVYASGGFWSAGTCTTADGCKYIAKWDGVTWSALNKGFYSSDYYYGRVSAIALKSGAVFAGGLFSAAGNAADADTPASNIAVFSPSTSTSTTISTTVPAEGSTLASSPSTLTVKFSAAVVNDSTENPKSATSLSNYMLVGPGLNSVFDTTVDAPAICSSTHTPSGDDLNISIASISYNAATFTATLTIAPASLPLAAGPYRLYVCGAASINDMLGNKINGGANFPVNFSVTRSAAAAAADKYSKLPKTGFAPNRISVLPQ